MVRPKPILTNMVDTSKCCRIEITSSRFAGGHLVVAAPGVVVGSCFAFAWCVGKEWKEVKAWFNTRPREYNTTITVKPELFAWLPEAA